MKRVNLLLFFLFTFVVGVVVVAPIVCRVRVYSQFSGIVLCILHVTSAPIKTQRERERERERER